MPPWSPPSPACPPKSSINVVVAETLYRLQELLQALSGARRADLDWDDGADLSDRLLVRRTFGSEILSMWRWRDGSQLATATASDPARSGSHSPRPVERVDGEGGVGFDVLVGCPTDAASDGRAWALAHGVTDHLRALTGELMTDPDVRCTIHDLNDVDQGDDPEDRADLEEEAMDANIDKKPLSGRKANAWKGPQTGDLKKPGVKGCGVDSQAVSWPYSQFFPSREGVDSPFGRERAAV